MGSDTGWKVGGARDNLTPLGKDFKKSTIVLQKSGRVMAHPHPGPLLWRPRNFIGSGLQEESEAHDDQKLQYYFFKDGAEMEDIENKKKSSF